MSNTGDPSSTAAFGIYTKTKDNKGNLVNNWPFYIRYDGTFHAENADISGVIKATTLSIGGTGSEAYVKGVANIDYINALGVTAKTFSAETVSGKKFTASTIRTGTEDDNVYISNAGAAFYWDSALYGTITTTQTVPRDDMESVDTFWTLLANKNNVDAISFGFNSNGTPAYFLYHDTGLYSDNCAAHNFMGGDVYCTGSLGSEGTISANKLSANSDVIFSGSLAVRKTVGTVFDLEIQTRDVFEGAVFSSSNVVSGGNQGIGIR